MITRFLVMVFAIFMFCPQLEAKTGLPVPRFVSLRSDKVNLRVGPGTRYPILWVLVRAKIPLEIVAEYDTWRKVRLFDGTEGWLHGKMLSGVRNFVVIDTVQAVHKKPDAKTAEIAYLEPGVIGKVEKCQDNWCRIKIKSLKGWIQRTSIWGVYEGEKVK